MSLYERTWIRISTKVSSVEELRVVLTQTACLGDLKVRIRIEKKLISKSYLKRVFSECGVRALVDEKLYRKIDWDCNLNIFKIEVPYWYLTSIRKSSRYFLEPTQGPHTCAVQGPRLPWGGFYSYDDNHYLYPPPDTTVSMSCGVPGREESKYYSTHLSWNALERLYLQHDLSCEQGEEDD